MVSGVPSLPLSLPKTLYGSNAFEINDFQEQEKNRKLRPRDSGHCNVTMRHIALKLVSVSIRQGHRRLDERLKNVGIR